MTFRRSRPVPYFTWKLESSGFEAHNQWASYHTGRSHENIISLTIEVWNGGNDTNRMTIASFGDEPSLQRSVNRERSRWRPIVQDRIRSHYRTPRCPYGMYPTKTSFQFIWKVTVNRVHVDGCNQIDHARLRFILMRVYMLYSVINHDFNGRSSRWYVILQSIRCWMYQIAFGARCKRETYTWILTGSTMRTEQRVVMILKRNTNIHWPSKICVRVSGPSSCCNSDAQNISSWSIWKSYHQRTVHWCR
jgi:hypothetical protein